MLALRALAGPGAPDSAVIIPSFTCAAMAGAVQWSGFSPLFVDVEPDGWHLDPAALEAALAAQPVAAVLASATFGTPRPDEQSRAWLEITAAAGVPLIYDAAAGLGAAEPLGRRHGVLLRSDQTGRLRRGRAARHARRARWPPNCGGSPTTASPTAW